MSILIGKHIKAILGADQQVTRWVGNRIYPGTVTNTSPAFPLIVYENLGTSPDQTKDGDCCDNCQAAIVLLHESYEDGLALANHIRYLFEGRTITYLDLKVLDCTLSGYSEQYDMDIAKRVFTLTFNFQTLDL